MNIAKAETFFSSQKDCPPQAEPIYLVLSKDARCSEQSISAPKPPPGTTRNVRVSRWRYNTIVSPSARPRYPEFVDPHRHERVAESIREELEELIGYELSDPRVGGATVTEVLLSPDFRQAHVRLALTGSDAERTATLEALEHAKQFLRHNLAERIQLFRTPELHFEADLPAQLGARAPKILKRIRRGRPKPEKNTTR